MKLAGRHLRHLLYLEEMEGFYEQLPPILRFGDLFNEDSYREVPGDMLLAVTDVVSSTQAISEGRYKDVNIAGAIAAMAIGNLQKGLRFPFVFGGDGMACLVPAELADGARDVLADTRSVVRNTMDLDLRVALVPAGALAAAGAALRIGRYIVDERYAQAVFLGKGLSTAERWVKREGRFVIPESHVPAIQADFSGFTCRWQDLPSENGETIALIVEERRSGILPSVVNDVEEICGMEENYRPISVSAQKLLRRPADLDREARVHTRRRNPGFIGRLGVRMSLIAEALIIALRLPVRMGDKDLRKVREQNVQASDFRKVDGGLKMVLSVTTDQRIRLRERLESRRSAGELYFGIHVSDRALMTCLIDTGGNGEVHFIDAADGGYALAARELKAQVAAE